MRSAKSWIIVLAILSALLAFLLVIIGINSAGGFAGILASLGPQAPTIAALAGSFSAIVAASALVVSARSNYQNSNRQSRYATIQAWTDWSNSTSAPRRLIRQKLGDIPVSSEQAQALTQHQAFLSNKNVELSAEESLALYRSILQVLNGLERLAVGIERNIYDAQTVRELGATIVVKQHAQLENYIYFKQTAADKDKRQQKAYVALCRLASDFARHDIDQERIANYSRKGR